MKIVYRILGAAAAVAPALIAGAAPAQHPSNPAETAAMAHVRALESLPSQSIDEAAAAFEAGRFTDGFLAETTAEERRALLSRIREAAAGAGGIGLDADEAGTLLVFESPESVTTVRFVLEPRAPYRIASLTIPPPEAPIVLEAATLEEQVDAFVAQAGGHGLVFLMKDGEVLLEKPYGLANEALGVPISADTVFDTGSRPIDYTVAAILLLDQQGRLDRSDTLGDHFPDMPADRAGITIEQLMTGRSGFPDFPANDGDWDADLAWINRDEFERRSRAVPLLFAPSEEQRHSHWAFGLLAAIVERASGTGYGDFLRDSFFAPAGMERTGFYGETLGLGQADFAEGHGNQRGLPNIPPNWGPTSWLVMGSGGMVSTLGDLRRFYAYLLSGDVLDEEHRAWFAARRGQLDGTDRGTELFSFNTPDYRSQAYVFLTGGAGPGTMRRIIRPMIDFLAPAAEGGGG